VGGYVLEKRLGTGSFGTVFRAWRERRVYAVKLLYRPRVRGWADRELEVMLRLKRAGCLKLLGHGHWPEEREDFLFLVMPYVQGPSLWQWAWTRNPCALEVLEKELDVARQLKEAHGVGVVHRDVKCTNVLVGAADGKAVLVDFGLGTFAGAPEVTPAPQQVPGTRHYQSPEALRARRSGSMERYPPNFQDDLWAHGVKFYWLLCGRYPFVGRTDMELEQAILEATPVAPHVFNPRVPREVGEACMKMLAKAPEERYPDAGAVCQALEGLLRLGRERPEWQVPLCEPWRSEDERAARKDHKPREESEGWAWMWDASQPPRRGRPSPLEPPAPVPGDPFFSSDSPLRTPSPPGWLRFAWVPVLVVVGFLLLEALKEKPSQEEPAPEPPWEVASVSEPQEGGDGAAPERDPTPAPVAPATTDPETPHVKPSKPSTAAPLEDPCQPPKGMSLARFCATAVAATCVAACSGLPVRPSPPMQCSDTAVQYMRKVFFLVPGDVRTASLPPYDEPPQFISVKEGEILVEVAAMPSWGRMPHKTLLIGELRFGSDRVYGYFTKARTPDEKVHDVCIALNDEGQRVLGVRKEPGSTRKAAIVFSTVEAVVVSRFE
jgi:serine/threonine-protein kinase